MPGVSNTQRPLRRAARGRRGVALILTLLVLLIVTIVVMELAFSTKSDLRVAANHVGDLQNGYALKSGLAYAKVFLKDDLEKAGAVDHLHERWAEPIEPIVIVPAEEGIPAIQVTLALEDEERKFNLSSLLVQEKGKEAKVDEKARERLGRLLTILGTKDPSIPSRVADFMDADTEGQFEQGARNLGAGSFRLPSDLRLVPGITEVMLLGSNAGPAPVRGLLPLLTIWGDGKVNVNTAPSEVLQCLSPHVTPEIADAIVRFREGKSDSGDFNFFKNPAEDLKKVPQLTPELAGELAPLLVVKSRFFSVRLLAKPGPVPDGTVDTGGIEKRARAVVERKSGIVSLVVWQDDLNLRTRPEGQ
ncbi:MAG: type II secretion system minor pseudopilin GspK [Planctomycetes bacterium]|nr:type II secretion system minor pseudopilin GspK [Planctomycetota bacterium]